MAKTLLRHDLKPETLQLNNVEVSDLTIRRVRRGRGFSYRRSCGEKLAGVQRSRIEALAIPPAWNDVSIAESDKNYVQAVGIDASGRLQYIYHPDWRAACELAKFVDLPKFADGLPRLRTRVKRELLQRSSDKNFAIATAIRLIDRAGLRVGNRSNETYGAVSLTHEHVELQGSEVSLSYTAKGGKQRDLSLDDEKLARAIKRLMSDDGDEIFDIGDAKIRPSHVNRFIADTIGLPFTAKDFRTWGGSCRATRALFKDRAKTLKDISEAAAEWLGNTPAIAKSSYIHPAILDAVSQSPDLKLSGPVRLRKYERACYALIEAFTVPWAASA